ncbi:MAG: L,D-transpeptidase family protein [Thermoanaerobaculia bacterium]|nr:L,D-transpeptidase family protein [Thermoanaerobaculia bacterium]
MRAEGPLLRGLFVCGLLGALAAGAASAESVEQRLRTRLEHLPRPLEIVVHGEPIRASQALPEFYERVVYRPLWVAEAGPLPRAGELVEAIRSAARDGVAPGDYHLGAIEEILARLPSAPDAGALTDLELLLTDAFLVAAAHLVSGRVDPVTFDPEWIAVRREADLVALLERAVTTSSPAAELAQLLPEQPGYFALRDALETYRSLAAAGGWPSVVEGPKLEPGARDSRVVALRRRLEVTDDGIEAESEEPLYDAALEAAVKRFQERHGLAPDGVVGPRTLAALNAPASERVTQIELNLERWRWLPQDLGRRYVVVNIAGFELESVEQGSVSSTHRVAVGRSYRRTPVFSDAIRYLVLNPFWEVPTKLAVQDKLPEIRKDPAYLERQGFVVLQGWGESQRRVDPATLYWTALGRGNFPYRLRQDPGPLNALGRVKFMFPNRFNVYLHDTPGREVFASFERDVSSGCIRVERPLELAEWLLAGAERWDRAAIDRAVATGRETVVPLAEPVPVHLLYWTAWVDADGTVQFRRDIYGRDALLATALAGRY